MNAQHFVTASPQFALVAVTDASLRAEASHVVAATGQEVIACEDPREIAAFVTRAGAVVVDKNTAAHVSSLGRHDGIYFVATDAEAIDFEAAMRAHAQEAYLLPAESEDFLKELGSAQHLRADGGSAGLAAATAAGRRGTNASGVTDGARPGRARLGGGERGEGGASAGACSARVEAAGAAGAEPAAWRAAACGPVAVVGACGGVGTSTFAAALARVMARQSTVTLVDAVDASGGLDLLLGVEYAAGARWPDLNVGGQAKSGGAAISAADLRAALPTTADGIAVLSAARASGGVADSFRLDRSAVDAVVTSLAEGGAGAVIDMPALDPAAVGSMVPGACQHVIVVTASEVRPTARAAQLIAQLEAHKIPCSLVVRHRGWSGMSVAEVEELTRVDAVAVIPHFKRLPKAMETAGLPERLPRGLHTAAQRVLETVGYAA